MTLKLGDRCLPSNAWLEEAYPVFREGEKTRFIVLGAREEVERVVAALNWREAFHGTIEKRRAEKKAAGQ